MKLENNWKSKSLENLEKDYWREPEFSSNLVIKCHRLRKKQLKDFDIEDLRLMIGQNIGLNYLIPLAIEKLESNFFAEGNLYEGDLLNSVLDCDKEYWKREPDNWKLICNLFRKNKSDLEKNEDLDSIRKDLIKSFMEFEEIN